MSIPKIFCVNYQDATDRREFINEQSISLDLNIDFINSLNYSKLLSGTLYQNDKHCVFDTNKNTSLKKVNSCPICLYPELSCTLGHYSAVLKAYTENLEGIIIIEDDVCFIKNKQILHKYLNNIPSDADVILFCYDLGRKNKHTNFLKINKGKIMAEYNIFREEDYVACAAFYYLSKKGIRTYLKNQNTCFNVADGVIDVFYNLTTSSPLKIYNTAISLGMPYIMKEELVDTIVCPHLFNKDNYFSPKKPLKSLIREGR